MLFVTRSLVGSILMMSVQRHFPVKNSCFLFASGDDLTLSEQLILMNNAWGQKIWFFSDWFFNFCLYIHKHPYALSLGLELSIENEANWSYNNDQTGYTGRQMEGRMDKMRLWGEQLWKVFYSIMLQKHSKCLQFWSNSDSIFFNCSFDLYHTLQ